MKNTSLLINFKSNEMKKYFTFILATLNFFMMNAQVLKGNLWTAKKVENTYVISINDKASILESLTDFVTTRKKKQDKSLVLVPQILQHFVFLTLRQKNTLTKLLMSKWK